MYVKNIFFISSVLFSILTPSLARQCSKQGVCKCDTDDGSIDMSSLGSQAFTSNSYTYYPCSNTNPTDNECVGDYAVCLNGYTLGKHSSSTFNLDLSSKEVTITYSGGIYGISTVHLKCTTGTQPSLNYIGDSFDEGTTQWTDMFEFSGSVSCFITNSASGDGGGGDGFEGFVFFLFLLFLVLVTIPSYLIGFILFGFYKKERRGLDLIPHFMFWKDTPFLIRDGFYFVFSPIYKPLRDKIASPQEYAFI